MIYAYRRADDTVALYASESDRPAPEGWTTCIFHVFMAAWQLRDRQSCERLAFLLRSSAGKPSARQFG